MLSFIIAMLSAGAAYWVASSVVRKRRLKSRTSKEILEQQEEQYALEQENQQLRLQLGMSPERRVALEDPPIIRSNPSSKKTKPKASRSGFRFQQATTTMSAGGSMMPLIIMAGAAAVLLASKKKKRTGPRPISPKRDPQALKERLERKNELVARGRKLSDTLREGDLDELLDELPDELDRETDTDG